MIKNNKKQKNQNELNTLKVLLRSLDYQLEDLKSVNENIGDLNSDRLKRGQKKGVEEKFEVSFSNFKSKEL